MSISLNLARAWRSKNFDEIVGQELAVRMVKNSLFKNQLFPVYLIAGQRGCGKTTLGRVFAAAINCDQRESFSQNPREVALPCLVCQSCEAMRMGVHPDFYEIDAASHTGVDNVRSLIEGATLLPGLGKKKIYLIDEAHMLSKAAFNAFLKILEEPPASVVFMLATTDPHKILDTVRSRCFQLFLNPLEPSVLSTYLASICLKESLPYDERALMLIAHESEGSVRDALNIIERLRLAYGSITYDNVVKTLSDVGYNHLLELCSAAFTEPQHVVALLEKLNIKRFSAQQLWKKMIEVLRALIWAKAGQEVELLIPHQAEVALLLRTVTMAQLVSSMELWYKAEPLFIKTHLQHSLIEMLFLQMSGKPASVDGGNDLAIKQVNVKSESVKEPSKVTQTKPMDSIEKGTGEHGGPWENFVKDLSSKDDPLVLSIFRQGEFKGHINDEVTVFFAEHLSFFKELIGQTEAIWIPLLRTHFGDGCILKAEFKLGMPQKVVSPSLSSLPQAPEFSTPQVPVNKERQMQRPAVAMSQRIDLKDPEKFKKVRALLKFFPGTVTEEKGFTHE